MNHGSGIRTLRKVIGTDRDEFRCKGCPHTRGMPFSETLHRMERGHFILNGTAEVVIETLEYRVFCYLGVTIYDSYRRRNRVRIGYIRKLCKLCGQPRAGLLSAAYNKTSTHSEDRPYELLYILITRILQTNYLLYYHWAIVAPIKVYFYM